MLLRLFPLVLTTGAFTLLYVAVPNCGVQVRHGFAGALVVALSFIVVKWLFTRFMATASYALIYGTFAVIPIFLLWIYVCWVVILVGANLVRSIPLFAASHVMDGAHPTLLLLALLHRFWEKQQAGELLRVQELMDDGWPLKSVSAKQLLSLLGELQLVRTISQDEYLLVRDLGSVTLWDVLSHTPWAQPDAAALARPLPVVLRPHLPEPQHLRDSFGRLEAVARQEFSASFSDWFRDPAWWPAHEEPAQKLEKTAKAREAV
jgi:membrane protein